MSEPSHWTLRRFTAALTLTLAIAASAFAKDEMRPFNRRAAQVFDTAVTLASQQGAIIFSDKEHRIVTFKSGGYWNKGFEVQVQVEEAGDSKSLVTVKSQKTYFGAGWGAAARITKDFFTDLDKALK